MEPEIRYRCTGSCNGVTNDSSITGCGKEGCERFGQPLTKVLQCEGCEAAEERDGQAHACDGCPAC